MGRPGRPGRGSPQSTPTVDGDLVFALSKAATWSALDVAKGEIHWQKNFPRDLDGNMMSGWGYSESPLVDGDKLVCTPGGEDRDAGGPEQERPATSSGRPRCQSGDGPGYASIVVAEAAASASTSSSWAAASSAWPPRTASSCGATTRVANGTANIPTAIVQGDLRLLLHRLRAGAALLKLVPRGWRHQGQGGLLPQGEQLQNHHGGMVRVGDYIFGGHGHNQGFPICLEMKTGKVAWRAGPAVRAPGRRPWSTPTATSTSATTTA